MTDILARFAAARSAPPNSFGAAKGTRFPASYRGNQYTAVVVFIALAAVIVPRLASNPYTQNLVNLWLLYALAALGFYVIFGLAGQFAFSQAFLMGVGAYVSAWIAKSNPTWVAMLGAIAVVAMRVTRTRAFS